jgi:hypothetical protein
MRSREQITAFFDGFELVDPGVVFLPEWRPDLPESIEAHPERMTGLVGVGRRP